MHTPKMLLRSRLMLYMNLHINPGFLSHLLAGPAIPALVLVSWQPFRNYTELHILVCHLGITARKA